MDAQRMTRVLHREPPAVEVLGKAGGQLQCSLAGASLVGQPAEGKGPVVARRDDVCGVALPPDLHESRVLPGVPRDPFDPGVERMEAGSRDAVLQAGPCGTPERVRTRREALLKRLDRAPVGQDLRARKHQWARHVR